MIESRETGLAPAEVVDALLILVKVTGNTGAAIPG
jgi:hypothetical protein